MNSLWPSWKSICLVLKLMRFIFLFSVSRALVNAKRCWRVLREELRGQLAADFVHEPLSNPRAFRLLSVEPGGWTAPLECSLREVSLDDSITFTATSYTWKRDKTWKQLAGLLICFSILFVRSELIAPFIEAQLGIWAAKLFMSVTYPCQPLINFAMRVAAPIFEEHRRVILCNGKRMAVRANLYEFLLQVRQSGIGDAKYWIDAICIDQSNIHERSHQVRLMTTIYQQAEQVIAWLGPCPSLMDHPKLMGCVHFDFKISDLHDLHSIRRILLRPCARLHILCCGYFRRTWILQEAVLPRKVIFFIGQHRLSPDDVSSVVHMMDYWSLRTWIGRTYDLANNLLESRKRYRAKGSWTLSEYLTAAVGREASDVRDLIFAGSGMISPSEGDTAVPRSGITIHRDTVLSSSGQESLLYSPDYAACHLDVYTNCAHQLLRDEGLNALSFACSDLAASPSPLQPFPSWTPQLHLSHALPPLRAEVGDSFSAGGTTKAAISLMPENRIRLDSGADHVDVLEKVFGSDICKELIAEILGQSPAVYTPTKESMMTAISRTLVTDGADGHRITATECIEGLTDFLREQSKRESSSNPGRSLFYDIFKTSERAAYPDSTPMNLDDEVKSLLNELVDDAEFDDDMNFLTFLRSNKATSHNARVAMLISILFCAPSSPAYERALKQRCANRWLFITKKGYIGLGSSKVQNGDVVMVFPGAYVPFAMRPSSATTVSEKVRYQLVGEVYVHGIMDGERVSSPEWKPEPIVIE